MSGLEVVGVVLGSIPLVIAALEHYSDGMSTTKQMIKYECVFVDMETSLRRDVLIFRQSCEELLHGLMLPDNQFRDLIEKHEGWDDIKLDGKLRHRLGRDYAIYKSSVKQLGKKIDVLKRKLKLRDDLSAPFVQNGVVDDKLCRNFFTPWTCIKGGFSARRYNVLREDIAHDISTICTLTSNSIKLENSRHQRSRSANANHWSNVQNHAERLYKRLGSIMSQSCPCQCRPRANLRLDVSEKIDDGESKPEVDFGISFKNDSTAAAPLLWDWRDVQILPMRSSSIQCVLAFTLASTVLRLYNTPWLRESWGFDDIYFIGETQNVSLADQPYVSAGIVATTSQQTTQAALGKLRSPVKNRMIFSLGVALLDLSYGRPLSFFKGAEDLDDQGNEHILTEYSIAARLTESIHRRELPRYTKAVIGCIYPEPSDTCSFSLDNDMFRGIFYENVVLPLQEDYVDLKQ